MNIFSFQRIFYSKSLLIQYILLIFATNYKIEMKITILQTDIRWGNPSKNADDAYEMMKQVEKSDLYVLPEMWSTGFATNPIGMAEPDGGLSLEGMKDKADEFDAAICGSISILNTKDGTYRNRHYFVCPESKYVCYDKHHLFSYGGEDRFYTAGDERTTAYFRGFRFLLTTCYDLRFPKWVRYEDDYDAIIVVANWPKSRQNAWQILTRARAIENQSFLIGCNRVGEDESCQYIGRSVVVSPKGQTIAQAVSDKPQTITADISIESLNRLRGKFRVLDERD